jgi:hypothetical protein
MTGQWRHYVHVQCINIVNCDRSHLGSSDPVVPGLIGVGLFSAAERSGMASGGHHDHRLAEVGHPRGWQDDHEQPPDRALVGNARFSAMRAFVQLIASLQASHRHPALGRATGRTSGAAAMWSSTSTTRPELSGTQPRNPL